MCDVDNLMKRIKSKKTNKKNVHHILVKDNDGMLKDIEYTGNVLPFLDHYNVEMNKKLGKKLFKE